MQVYNYLAQKVNGNIQIHTTGCELCISDACKFASTINPDEKAIVFGTCSFIEDRERENEIILRLLKKAYPDHKVYVIGCDVDYKSEKFTEVADVLLKNKEVREIINCRESNEMVITENDMDSCIYVKVQDGCSHKCTFCIINQLRNEPYSVPYDIIVDDVKKQMAEKGTTKIALAGTELTTYYDKEKGYHLTDMLEHLIQDVPEIERIIMNAFDPQPKETENMIRLVAKYPKIFVPHMLLATQSGCDTILKAMGRRHNVERLRYLHKVADECGVTLGWDVIVGFPGETEELFMETYNLMKELHPFSQTLFMYSAREGTPAASMPDQVPEEIKAERLKRITELKYENACKYKDSFKNYVDYTEEELFFNQCTNNKLNAIKILQDENGEEMYLDMFDDDAVVKFILNPPENTVVHVKFDTEREIESGIMINLFKHLAQRVPLVVHIPKDFDYDVKFFEKCYQCIIKVD